MRERINSIDILRMIAALAVVMIHGCAENVYVNAVSRFAVPIFFMISGYFYCVSKERQKLRIQKMFILMIAVNLAFFCFAFFIAFIKGNVVSYLTETFTIKNIVKFVFFNESKFGAYGAHLWFLSALLYCMIIDYFLSGFFNKKKKCCAAVIIILFLGYFVIEKYSPMLVNLNFSALCVRNFLFLGLPYFWLGKLLRNIDVAKIKLNNFVLILSIILLAAMTLAEKYMLIIYFDFNGARDQYIFTIFLSLAIFILALKNPLENPGKISGFIAASGRKYSLGIYIIHPFILKCLAIAASTVGKTLKGILLAIAAFAVSWLIIAIYYFVKEKVCFFYKSKKSKSVLVERNTK